MWTLNVGFIGSIGFATDVSIDTAVVEIGGQVSDPYDDQVSIDTAVVEIGGMNS
jgi:hypothetical protein